jgi:hypothetical protein
MKKSHLKELIQSIIKECDGLSGMKKTNPKMDTASSFKPKDPDFQLPKVAGSKQKMVSEVEFNKDTFEKNLANTGWVELVIGGEDHKIASFVEPDMREAVEGELSEMRQKFQKSGANEYRQGGHWQNYLNNGASPELVKAVSRFFSEKQKRTLKESVRGMIKEVVDEYRTKGALSANNPNRKAPVKLTGKNYQAKGVAGMGRPKAESVSLEVYFDDNGKQKSLNFDFLNTPWPSAKKYLEAEVMAELRGDAALVGKIDNSVYEEIEKAKENDLDGKLTLKNNVVVLYYDEPSKSLKAETAQLEENDANTTSTGPYHNMFGDDSVGDKDIS